MTDMKKDPATPKQKLYLHMSDGTILFVEVEPDVLEDIYTMPFMQVDDLIINVEHIVYITLPTATVSENKDTTPEEENLAVTQPYVGSN